LQADYLGRPDTALVVHERSKSRELGDRIGTSIKSLPANWQDHAVLNIYRKIPPGAGLLEYRLLSDKLLIWFADSSGIELREVEIESNTVERAVDHLCQNITSRGKSVDSLVRVYDILIKPVESWLPGVETLIVVPDESLYKVPFPALMAGPSAEFLIESKNITIMPSAFVAYVALSRRMLMPPSVPPKSAMIIGDPLTPKQFGYGLDPLPGARKQAEMISRLYHQSNLLVGVSASKRVVVEGSRLYDVIHFGTHTLIDEAQPGGASIVLSSEAGVGLLSANEVAGLDLNASVVVLAVCEGAVGKASKTEGAISLVRSFFLAGAPSVVASLWKVEDEEIGQLMLVFHQELSKGYGPVAALRKAQVDVIRQGGDLRNWSAFEVFGSVRLYEAKENP